MSILMAVLAISLFATTRALANTPPVVTPPADIIVEAESPDGTLAINTAIAAFLQGATAVHEAEVSFPVTAVSLPEVFPLGATPVTFSATDAAANTGTAQAKVTVVDTTPPALIVPGDITVEAESSNGTAATNVTIAAFLSAASALDLVDLAVYIVNDAPLVFLLGSTLVTFSVTDTAANTIAAGATVTVTEAGGLPPAPVPVPIAAPPRDFFGTVVVVETNSLSLETEGVPVNVLVSGETKIRIPRNRNAAVTDLVPGDVVAVSISDGDIADKIVLIPGKTRNRHVPGTVEEIDGSTMTIQPPGANASPITFDISSATIRFHKGEDEIMVGSFVVVGTARDPVTGELSGQAREINVTARKSKLKGPQATPADGDAGDTDDGGVDHQNTADIHGVFEGVDADGNLIVNGATIVLDPDTEIDAGLVTGQLLEIEAVITPDGKVLAREVEEQEEEDQPSEKTNLEGAFDGVDEEGNWIISGTPVAIGPGSDTDGLPAPGQQVKVKALLQEDGSLFAREVENKSSVGKPDEKQKKVKLNGIFEGIDVDGNWIVSGKPVAVDALTRLEGSPAVGQRIAVKGFLGENGVLLAKKVKSAKRGRGQEKGDKRGRGHQKREAKIRGKVQDILADGTLVVNGIPVAVGALTELEDGAQVGDFVEIEALLQEDGSLLAEEVDNEGALEEEDIPEASKVEIEGTLESFDEDENILIVNGVTVALSALSDVEGNLIEGSDIKLKGILNPDGTVSARKVKGKGRKATASGTEAEVDGVIEQVNRDETGNIVSVVVDGLTVGVEALTDTEGALEAGTEVSVEAIISDGAFLASKIKTKKSKGASESTEVEIEGVIEALTRDDEGRVLSVTINGVEVALGDLADVEGLLEIGESVEIEGALSQGVLLASKAKVDGRKPKRVKPSKFDVEGLIEAVQLDANGNVVSVTVDGQEIATEALTRIKSALEVGLEVEVKGVVSDGRLIAEKIKKGKSQEKADKKEEKDREKAEKKAKKEREKAEAKAEKDRGKSRDKDNDDNDDDD